MIFMIFMTVKETKQLEISIWLTEILKKKVIVMNSQRNEHQTILKYL